MSNHDDDGEWEPTPVNVPRITGTEQPGVLVPARSNTPPGGVPAAVAPPQRAPTGGYSNPDDRSGQPKNASARAAFREISALRKDLALHSQSDQIALKGIHDKLTEQDKTLDEQNKILTSIQVAAASTKTAVDLTLEELRHNRGIQKIRVEGEVTTGLEKEKTKREGMSGRTKVWLALISVLSIAVGAIAKWIAG